MMVELQNTVGWTHSSEGGGATKLFFTIGNAITLASVYVGV